MEQEKLQKYYTIMERITFLTCTPEGFDRAEFVTLLGEFCELFRISKGVTEFYQTPRLEEAGEGEVLIDYDNGKGDIPVVKVRITPPSGVVIKGTLYMAKDDEPLPEDELEEEP